MQYMDNKLQGVNRNNSTDLPAKIKNRITVSIPRDTFSEVKDIEHLKFKVHIKNMYKDICNKINLQEQITPKLKFESLGAHAAGGFSNIDGKIYFDDNFLKQLEDSDIVFVIRHELEHVKQFHEILRLLGLKKFVKLMVSKDENCPEEKIVNSEKVNINYYKKVEQMLGKIDPNSPEGILAQKYIDAYKKYPDLMKLWQRTDICKVKKILIFIKELICNYKFNFLETSANKAAKNFLKTFKV